MTVDELLLKLDAELEKITGELPDLYRALGSAYYHNHAQQPKCWAVESAIEGIARKYGRQSTIRNLQSQIRQEVERTTA